MRLRGRQLPAGSTPAVMGILNVTPDSFSDGGLWLDPRAAVEHGLAMLAAGADLLDLGAESTRPGGGVYGPGAEEVPAARELERLLPVLRQLRAATDAPLSVDTRKAEVAEIALSEGADLINDVSALEDPGMAALVARRGCPVILMHSRGELATMQRGIGFADPAAEVAAELAEAAARAMAAGIAREAIILDPGIGFGKTAEHNLDLLRRLDELVGLGYPVVVGASRKSFLAAVVDAPPAGRLAGSLAAAAWAAHHGAALLRVHDVAETRQFLAVWGAIERAGAAA
ncbi:MAG: dihydropteroate synthase [Acidobacteriota bacterium]|nr:dihydropteroate synthase [Acidobacteriota bacterium]MDH3525054.1 dihydropteroate synthase [Acidobacteriota bacterium]